LGIRIAPAGSLQDVHERDEVKILKNEIERNVKDKLRMALSTKRLVEKREELAPI
jgi:hypothetical protein